SRPGGKLRRVALAGFVFCEGLLAFLVTTFPIFTLQIRIRELLSRVGGHLPSDSRLSRSVVSDYSCLAESFWRFFGSLWGLHWLASIIVDALLLTGRIDWARSQGGALRLNDEFAVSFLLSSLRLACCSTRK